MRRSINDDGDLLAQLASLGSNASDLVAQLQRRHKGGRRPIPAANFRRLELLWKYFIRAHSELDADAAARKFLHDWGAKIESLLGLHLNKQGSLRNAVARGAKESARIYKRRCATWRKAPTSLAEVVRGRNWQIVTDPNEAMFRLEVARRVLLGDGGHLFGVGSPTPTVSVVNVTRTTSDSP
jgi:hypothetical protein